DVAIFVVLIPLDDVVEVDDLAVLLAHPLVADAPHVLVVELVELQGLLLGGRVHGDRDRHEAERDGPLPHRSGHVVSLRFGGYPPRVRANHPSLVVAPDTPEGAGSRTGGRRRTDTGRGPRSRRP